ACNMVVVPADGLLRDLPGVFVVAENVGDGQRRKVQSTRAAHALDTHQREQYDNGRRCGEAVLEIRIADLMEYRPLAFFPYRTVIDVIGVEGVKRLFVPRCMFPGLLASLAVYRNCCHEECNEKEHAAFHGLGSKL